MAEAPRGHIKIARKAFHEVHGDRWFLEKRAFSKWEAWLDMIQIAQFGPREIVTTKFGTIKLGRGEFVMSQRTMASRWGWTHQTVRTFVNSAEFRSRIHTRPPQVAHTSDPRPATHPATQAGTVYVIVNYDTYQSRYSDNNTPDNTPINTPVTHLQHTSNTRDKQLSSKAVTTSTDYSPEFESLWLVIPKRRGGNPKPAASHAYAARRKEGVPHDDMVAGAKRYDAYLIATNRANTEYVMQAKRFLGPERPFADDWAYDPPAPPTNGAHPKPTTRVLGW